jgi:hypothetical protein
MILRIPIVFGALCAITASASVKAQRENASELWRVVAEHVRADLPNGLILLDPRVGHVFSIGQQPSGTDHAVPTLAFLEGALRARVARMEDVIRCTPNDPRSCRFVQGVGVVAFGEPVFRADTAFVRVFSAVATPEPRMPISQQEMVLVVLRRAQKWEVVEKRIERVS